VAKLLGPLAEKYEVRAYSFADRTTPLEPRSLRPRSGSEPDPPGAATRLGDAIGRVLEEAGDRHAAGVIILSDGQNTAGQAPGDSARAARTARTPLFTVPCGTAAPLEDISLVDVFTSGTVSLHDTATVAVTLEAHGFAGRSVKVELRDGDKVLDTKDLVLRGGERQQLELTFQAKEPGLRQLTVRVPPLPEEPELLHGNNTDTAVVRVSDEKLKVLFVEGWPRWDFRYLKNTLGRDHGIAGRTTREPDIILEAEWRRLPPAQRSLALPQQLEQLTEYDTVILGDASPQLLTAEFLDLLNKGVRDKGVGLIVAAGPRAMPHAFPETFRDLLPVRLRPGVAGFEAPAATPFRIELTPAGTLHEVMRFQDDPAGNRSTWEQFPPSWWCAAAERPAAGATVLAWNPRSQDSEDRTPLIAYHHAGQGKVLFVGTDSTWSWRQNEGERLFGKFWGQAIRFVARQDETASKKTRLEVRSPRVRAGEQSQVELWAFTPDGTPRTDPALVVGVGGPGHADVLWLAPDANAKGRYTGTLAIPTAGEHRVRFDPGGGNAIIEAKVQVQDSNLEWRHPNVNRAALQQIASESGGKLVEIPDLETILPLLGGESRRTEMHRQVSLWDNWLTLALLAGLFCLDVALRRLLGLS
jgi:hypothetical protein